MPNKKIYENFRVKCRIYSGHIDLFINIKKQES